MTLTWQNHELSTNNIYNSNQIMKSKAIFQQHRYKNCWCRKFSTTRHCVMPYLCRICISLDRRVINSVTTWTAYHHASIQNIHEHPRHKYLPFSTFTFILVPQYMAQFSGHVFHRSASAERADLVWRANQCYWGFSSLSKHAGRFRRRHYGLWKANALE